MVSVPEATSIILSKLFSPRKEIVKIVASVGRTLGEPIYADRDFPPFNRVTMDGIALSVAEFEKGIRSFKIHDTLAAGQPQKKLPGTAGCMEVMTGAVLPEGTDTVVRYEDLEISNGAANVLLEKLSKGDNIHFQGMDAKNHELLLSPGITISPAEVALIASVGKSEINVLRPPTIAIVSTGDELVPIHQTPLVHQIRQSNVYALQSALLELSSPAHVFWIKDEKEVMEKSLAEILSTHELVILSGGVSKGKFDYVPQVLESLGVKKHFHQVSQKPGKPFWFGASATTTVFALPGNPVSTYMCFYRFVKPWLMKSMGVETRLLTATLGDNFSFKPPLTYFLQVRMNTENGKLVAHPDAGGGSGDFANLKEIDGFLELPAEQTQFLKGDVFSYIPFRR